MNKRKLLLGLTTAGAITAGFGSSVVSANADPRTFQVTLLGGAVFLKVRYIGLEFMELRGSTPVLRRLFEGWVLLVGAALVVLQIAG